MSKQWAAVKKGSPSFPNFYLILDKCNTIEKTQLSSVTPSGGTILQMTQNWTNCNTEEEKKNKVQQKNNSKKKH